jgi:UDP-N-acetylmuramate dehydrogenase
MAMESLLKNILANLSGVDLFLNEDLTTKTTMRLKSQGHLIVVRNEAALLAVVEKLVKNKISYQMIGWGANSLLPAQIDRPLLKMNFVFDIKYFENPREIYELPASLPLTTLTSHALKFGIAGWEVLTGIPATLGGAIFMNAGTKFGEIADIVTSVRILDCHGKVREHIVDKNSFSYRKNNFIKDGDIILSAKLKHHGTGKNEVKDKIREYIEYRKQTQPLGTKNCGCVFKNPKKDLGAGMLIDILGLKGLRVGGLEVSSVHGNFIENTSVEANLEDFHHMVETINLIAESYVGLRMDLEVKI